MRSQRVALLGGCFLAFGAAFANAGVMLIAGTSVSHLTGDISRLSIDLARGGGEVLTEGMRVAVAAGAFFLGCVVAGAWIHHPTLDLARPYGRSITGIGVLFLASSFLADRHPVAAIGMAAFGCGLQNSLASHYRGIVLRTTHLTGLITDFGITLGMRLRGFDIPVWKISVPGLLMLSFFLGGIASAFVYLRGESDTIFLAGIGYCAGGITWTVLKHIVLPRMEKRREKSRDR